MKKLEYEIIEEPDANAESVESVESVEAGADGSLPAEANAVEAERDRFEELKAAVEKTERIRFRVRPDYKSTYWGSILILLIIELAGGILLRVSKSKAGDIIVCVIMGLCVIVAVCVMIAYTAKSRRVHYCYYKKEARGIFCTSVIDDEAVIFAYGTAYKINRDGLVMLDADAFSVWLEGESTGLFAIANARREDFFYSEEDGAYIVKTPYGGEHAVFISNGEIIEIVSHQPFRTEFVDTKTGEARVKLRVYDKTDPTDIFAWEIPAFVKEAFEGAGMELPDMDRL